MGETDDTGERCVKFRSGLEELKRSTERESGCICTPMNVDWWV